MGEHELYTIAYANKVSKSVPSSCTMTVNVNKVSVEKVKDTGAVVTVLPNDIYFKNLNPCWKIVRSSSKHILVRVLMSLGSFRPM